MQIKFKITLATKILATAGLVLCLFLSGATSAQDNATTSARDRAATDAALPAALCQVVYPLDQSAEEGYRYMFFGNGFFINRDGYLVTAAHLLSYFRNGGDPYILVGPQQGPRRMLSAPIAAVDWDHDVAVLRATPNPFQTEKSLAYLPLSTKTLAAGNGVLSASLLPPDIQNAHSLAEPLQEISRGQLIDYRFYREKDEAERELLLFDQEVSPGQSGAPLISAQTHAAVGVVVGQWLHPVVIPAGAQGGHHTLAPGAALRIHYAIALLQQQHISWDMASESSGQSAATATPPAFAPPVPLSVVATPYPPQALFGGDVLLDALVDASGKLSDVRVVEGDSPFVETVVNAVHTWSFMPARRDGRAVVARIGIVFQFPQSLLPHVVSKEHKHQELSATSGDRPALPLVTIEPDYPPRSAAEGSVALYELIDAQGQITSTSILQSVDSLTAPTTAAVHQWRFASAQQGGANTDSAVVVVVTFRRPTL